MVTTSNEKKKTEMEVSTNWYVIIEYQRLSLIRVIFIDYQTSKFVMGHLDTNNFYFLFLLFFGFYFTFLLFYFLWKDDEEGM